MQFIWHYTDFLAHLVHTIEVHHQTKGASVADCRTKISLTLTKQSWRNARDGTNVFVELPNTVSTAWAPPE